MHYIQLSFLPFDLVGSLSTLQTIIAIWIELSLSIMPFLHLKVWGAKKALLWSNYYSETHSVISIIILWGAAVLGWLPWELKEIIHRWKMYWMYWCATLFLFLFFKLGGVHFGDENKGIISSRKFHLIGRRNFSQHSVLSKGVDWKGWCNGLSTGFRISRVYTTTGLILGRAVSGLQPSDVDLGVGVNPQSSIYFSDWSIPAGDLAHKVPCSLWISW